MAKTRTTVTLEEGTLRAVKIRAARTGKRESQVIEEALRRDFDWLEDVWSRVKNPIGEKEAMELAYSELRAMREERRAASGP
jgi:hypothetical protein